MNLNKDQKQKIALGAMILIGVGYGFFEFLISPVSAGCEMAIRNTATAEPAIRVAKAQIAKTKALEEKMPEIKMLSAQVDAMIPDGAPVAWFPPRLAEYFKRHGVDKLSARQVAESADKDLAGYRRISWGVEFPRVEFFNFGQGLAELENGDPLVEVQAIDFEVNRDEVQAQRVSLSLVNLVRQ